ncbi:MAG: hypothetical protein LUQ02_00955, partial [Methanothrix sp.]|nr:hypothetical protein [Methanothrix sp.]
LEMSKPVLHPAFPEPILFWTFSICRYAELSMWQPYGITLPVDTGGRSGRILYASIAKTIYLGN